MAIIQCPECGNRVSSKAASCPKCGHPIASPRKNGKQVVAKEGCFLQTLNVGCIIIFAIIALIVLLILFASTSEGAGVTDTVEAMK